MKNKRGFRRLCLVLVPLLVLLTYAGKLPAQNHPADAVLTMPQGLPKLSATLELLRQFNTSPSPQLADLIDDAVKFTSKPAFAVQKEELLIAAALFYLNAGQVNECRNYLRIAEAHRGKFSLNDQFTLANLADLYILLGDKATATKYLNQDKTRGRQQITGLLATVQTYALLDDKKKAAATLDEADGIFDFINPDNSETGHILCQLIIQSVRLKRYKELDKYYEQLKHQASYKNNFEYVLAQGLYFSVKNNQKEASAAFETLAEAFGKGNKNPETLEGTIRLAALLSTQRFETAANRYFEIARKALTKELLVQPVGMIYTELYQEHNLRYKGRYDLDGLLSRSPVLDSAFKAEILSQVKELNYQLNLNIRKATIDSLRQAKIVTDMKINRDRQRNWLITLSLVLMLCVAFIIIYIFYQRRKRSILLFEAEKERTENLHKQELSKLLASTQEEERSKIAEKLHDEIGSMLAVVRLNLSSPDGNNANLPRAQLNTANKVLNEVADTVRQMSHELMPVLIQKMGLRKAIEQLVEDINTAGRLQIECIVAGSDDQFEAYDYEFKVNIYRIVQELLHNILKHARATSVSLQLIQHPDGLNMMVEDNGIGMKKGKADGKGMKLIAARVSSYQGTLTVESNAESGTVVVIDIPSSQPINA